MNEVLEKEREEEVQSMDPRKEEKRVEAGWEEEEWKLTFPTGDLGRKWITG